MPAHAAHLLVLATIALLAGCRHDIKSDLPTTIIKPKIVYVERDVYVRIKPELTREEPIAEGPLSQCPAVAAARRSALEKINARVREISKIQGTPAQEP